MSKLEFEYQLSRSDRRKTVGITVLHQQVKVVAPRQLSDTDAHQVVVTQREWIINKLRLHSEHAPATNAKEYISGEAFSYLGRNYRLKVVYGEPAPVKLLQGRLVATVPSHYSKAKKAKLVAAELHNWYRCQAHRLLTDKTRRIARQLGVQPGHIPLKASDTRWGHCTTGGNIEYNWRIVAAPQSMVDYVVAHEVCHLVHHNHSKAFWSLVGKVLPDYAVAREWLRVNGVGLSV